MSNTPLTYAELNTIEDRKGVTSTTNVLRLVATVRQYMGDHVVTIDLEGAGQTQPAGVDPFADTVVRSAFDSSEGTVVQPRDLFAPATTVEEPSARTAEGDAPLADSTDG